MRMLQGIERNIGRLSGAAGRLAGWLCLAMILVVFYDVVMRYAFSAGSVAMQELEWHLFASMFLLGAAYTMREDGNVRVDIFYAKMTARKAALVNIAGTILFVFPMCLLIIYSSYDFVGYSYRIGEVSPDPGGLSYRFLIKAVLPVAFALVFLQGIGVILSNLPVLIKRGERQMVPSGEESA